MARITSSKWKSFHAANRDDLFIVKSETACEVRILVEHFLVIILPMEVCVNQKRHLQVSWHSIRVQLFVLRVIDIVNLNIIFGEARSVNTDLDRHGILTDIRTISIKHLALRQSLRSDRVLVDKLSRGSAWCLIIAKQVTVLK